MRRRRPNALRRLLVILALAVPVLGVIALALEYGAGRLVKAMRDKRPVFAAALTDDDLRRLYDSEDAVRLRALLKEGAHVFESVYEPFVEYRTKPFAGTYYTFRSDGSRSNGPAAAERPAEGPQVFVFGGSTVLGAGLADDETIAARMEQAFAAAGRPEVRVTNFAAAGYTSTQERLLLEKLLIEGRRPDVAVFIDGEEDFFQCNAADRTAWSRRLAAAGAKDRDAEDVESERLHLVELFRHLGGDKSVLVRDEGRFCETDSDLDVVIDRLDANRRMIDALAERWGFKAVFVQQPVPVWNYDNRKRPLPVSEEMLGHHVNAAKGYHRLSERRAAGRLWDKGLVWLAEAEPAEGNAYIDVVHYSPRFAALIGERLAGIITDGGLLPTR